MAAVLLLSVSGVEVLAVTGSQVAADGTYTGSSKEGTVTVTVSDGKIVSVSADVKSKYQSYITSAFSSVTGKAATYNNIDSVSAATKHIGYIKSGALSAISSAPAADGSDDSGSGSGDDSGSGSGNSETEYAISVGGTQELSVIEDDFYTYTWSSSDTSKVTVSGSGHTATVTGVAATTSPVTVSCTYGFMGITNTKEFSITVTGSNSGSETDPEEDDSEIGQGVGSKTGTKYTGTAYVNGDTTDEWVTLDVYVSDGKITGIFIAAEDGSWLNLLTTVKDSFLGIEASTLSVDAVSSATTKGFRDTIRNAISNALESIEEETVTPPELISGNGGSFTKGSGGTLTFISNADFSGFKSVKVDGSALASSDYTVKSGSTVVTLGSSCLENLSTGSHSIGIVSENGTASGSFTVAEEESGDSGSGSGASGSYTGTIVSSLTDGDYIIVDRYSASYSYYALGNTTAGSSGGGYGYAGVDVSISENTATISDAAGVWTWDSSNNSFYNEAAGKYLALPSSAYSAGNFFSSSPVALTFYTVSGNEATVYNPYGNGGYYLNAAYPSNGKAFASSYARYVNSSYLSSGSGVYFYKIDSNTELKASIELDKTALSLLAGGTGAVNASLTGCTLSSAVSSNDSVATVSINGNVLTVTAVSTGTAVVTVTGTAAAGYTAPDSVTFTVTVSDTDSGGQGGGETEEDTPAPDYVKAITPDGEISEDYAITLNVTGVEKTTATTQTGTSVVEPADILIVLDNTTSMSTSYGNTTRIAALRTAAADFVNNLPVSDSSKIAMISFVCGNYTSKATLDVSWTALNASGKSAVNTKISGLTAPSIDYGYDTYFGPAINMAASQIGNLSDSNKKYVVFFTDGAAAESASTISDYVSGIHSAASATFSIGITK